MHVDRFDHLVRSLAFASSRRSAVGWTVGSVAAALGIGNAAARNKRRKKKKIKRNEFGCVDVGRFCKNAGQCCSGLCQGKKGKKKCKAHDSGDCAPGAIPFACDGTEVPCTTSAGVPGSCGTTTGGAGYCFSNLLDVECTSDTACQAESGPRAACVKCPTMSAGALCAVVALSG